MKRFLVPAGSASHTEQTSWLQACAIRSERAAELGVPWPPRKQTRRGRPSLDELWIAAVQAHISKDLPVPVGISAERPSWWREGMSLERPPLTVEELSDIRSCSGSCIFYFLPTHTCDVSRGGGRYYRRTSRGCGRTGLQENQIPRCPCVQGLVLGPARRE